MDFLTIKAAVARALKKLGGAEQAASQAAQAANNAAGAANTAAGRAEAAASEYVTLTEYEKHDRIALNMMYTILQAEQRSDDKRITTLESKVQALT